MYEKTVSDLDTLSKMWHVNISQFLTMYSSQKFVIAVKIYINVKKIAYMAKAIFADNWAANFCIVKALTMHIMVTICTISFNWRMKNMGNDNTVSMITEVLLFLNTIDTNGVIVADF